MKTYKIAKKWRIIIYSIGSLTALFYGTFAIISLLPNMSPFQSDEEPSVKYWLMALFFLMVLLMLFVIARTYKAQIVITQDSLQLMGVFKKKELKFTDIKGFDVQSNPKLAFHKFLGVESKTKGKKAIVFSNVFENFEEIKSILSSKVTDLNAEKAKVIEERFEEEKKQILSNQKFGFSVEDRKQRLKKAKIIANALNGIAIVVSIWTFFFPRPYEYAIIACICLPLVAFVVIKQSKGLIKIDSEKVSVYPTAAFAVAFTGIVLFLRAMLDFSIDDYSNVWIPVIAIAIVFSGTVLMLESDFSLKSKAGFIKVFGVTMLSFAYGYGTVVTTNCTFDKSEPKQYKSEVLAKEVVRSRKTTSYDLKLSPWGNKSEIEKISIDSDLYNNLEVGDKVFVYQFQGKFNIPWIIVDYAR